MRAISESGDALRSARLALIPYWCHTTFVRSGRSGRPRETKGVTVTVPLLTGCEMRPKKAGSFLSVILRQTIIGGTGMVANSIQNLPAFVDSGQHSIVTAPADTGPSPRMRNLTLRGSGSTSFLPAPVVALSCNRLRTLIIVCALLHWDIDNWTGKDSESPPRRATYRPTLGNCVSSAGSSIIAWL